MARNRPQSTAQEQERALLVGVDRGTRSAWPTKQSLAELGRLAETDGAQVVGELVQRLDRPVPKTFIGSGKVRELAERVRAEDVDVVIFDEELSPSQQANLEKALGDSVKVIDRTALILDIFGRHATTREGRLQVQAAQLAYVYPRLRGMWSHLMGEQTRGGIGSRFGQGESQLEVDRRLVRKRIAKLKEELERLGLRRETQSKARWESGVYRVALAGYTNAGKSTLLNALTGASVYAQDELFATLDPTTRSLDLPEGRRITLTDTVGFIQKLPTTLVESFKSTLAEVKNAHLIVLVVDASDPRRDAQIQSVRDTLRAIDANDVDVLVCFNKIDQLTPEELEDLRDQSPEAVFVSAQEGQGFGSLLHSIAQRASADEVLLSAVIPFEKGILMKLVHERGRVVRESYQDQGLLVTAFVPRDLAAHLAPYQVDDAEEAAATRAEEERASL